ncbi:hypothetical protein E4T52_01791 [Aureobasidium sp. EXF-3400]|nr:hypothetical protein E4T51_01628 [Aureobasidium sp. EXF-12344]KAI4783364.1 hypothetical protein E4T52_01791 [Aureobasidium sp. EXF-3400]
MIPRYVPPHIRNRRSWTPADTANTAHATRVPEPLSFSPIHVSIDTDEPNSGFQTHLLPDRSQTSHQFHNPIAAMRRDIPTAPMATLRAPVTIFDRSTGRFVRPRRSSGPRRSISALEARVSTRYPTATMHGLSNPHSISTPRWASVTRPEPNNNMPHLVSLAEIATRFGLELDAIHTLNACSYARDVLKFIVLFEIDTRDRDRDLVIYAKTNLHLLPGHDLPYPDQVHEQPDDESDGWSDVYSESDLIDLRSRAGSAASLRVEVSSSSPAVSTPSSSTQSDTVLSPPGDGTGSSEFPPIALFSRVRPGQQGRAFEFLGWYEIEETEFFAPRTFELFRMLAERNDWQGTPSRAGMQCEWAKIRLVKQEGDGNVRSVEPAPQVDWTQVFSRYG